MDLNNEAEEEKSDLMATLFEYMDENLPPQERQSITAHIPKKEQETHHSKSEGNTCQVTFSNIH